MLSLLPTSLSVGERAVILAASANMPLDRLRLTVFVIDQDKIFADSFSNFGGFLSIPLAFLISIFLGGLLYKIG